jgi:hypothetical protein
MSAELIAQYRADASRHAELAEKLAVALMRGEITEPIACWHAREDLRLHNRQKELYRQQADALEMNPAAWVITPVLAWTY